MAAFAIPMQFNKSHNEKLYPLYKDALKAAAAAAQYQHPSAETQCQLDLLQWLGRSTVALPRRFLEFTGPYHDTLHVTINGRSFNVTLSKEWRPEGITCWRIMAILGTSASHHSPNSSYAHKTADSSPTILATFEIDNEAAGCPSGLEVLSCVTTIQSALAVSVAHASLILLRRARAGESGSANIVFVALRGRQEKVLMGVGA